MAQVFADPQTQHRQMVVELPHSSGQTVRLVRSPLNFSASPVTRRAPPRLGEQRKLPVVSRSHLYLSAIRRQWLVEG
jgi:crotonobetainyl-CoA:carnitine CoA-transferase CaiB-like acyl-CoA transferase